MLKKILMYAIALRNMKILYDKRLLYLLLIPPAVYIAKRVIPASRPEMKRSLAACLMGAATAHMELMSLKLKQRLLA
jgi:hypothetical protein